MDASSRSVAELDGEIGFLLLSLLSASRSSMLVLCAMPTALSAPTVVAPGTPWERTLEKLPAQAKTTRAADKALLSKLKKAKGIDDDFHRLHDEAFEHIDCLTCANCCRTTPPRIVPKDVDRLARALKMKPGDFSEAHVATDAADGELMLRHADEGGCPFLGSDNHCSVYDARPAACRWFPGTNQRKMATHAKVTLENVGVCPAVSGIVERLHTLRGGYTAAPVATRRAALLAAAAAALAPPPRAALAAKDCMLDCLQNCNRVAPGSGSYCDGNCRDYCAQDDRRDGLSGSVDNSGGEIGWLSAYDYVGRARSTLVGGGDKYTKAVPYGEDRPPALLGDGPVNDILRRAVQGK